MKGDQKMKKRNAKVFALFMSVAMAMPNVAAAMPVYAAPEAEEIEAEAEEDVEEVEVDEVEVEEETEAETEEEEIVEGEAEDNSDVSRIKVLDNSAIVDQGDCGAVVTDSVKWELRESGNFYLTATASETADGKDRAMTAYAVGSRPWEAYIDQIKQVVVDNELYNISDEAFKECKNLERVIINSHVQEIGVSAFEKCTNLTLVTYPSNDQANVKYYREAAFKDCTSLTTITFTKELTEINAFCFYNCKSLAFPNGLNLQGKLDTIETAAFWGCESLTSLILPANVKVIEGGYDNTIYTSLDQASNPNKLEGKWGAFAGCTGLTSVEFKPNNGKGIEYIGEFAFYKCTSLADVKLPFTLWVVDDYAFEDCTGLSSVTMEDSKVTELYGTFKRCNSLSTFKVIPTETLTGYTGSLYIIGKETFQSCTSLANVDLAPKADHGPVGLSDYEINESAFRDCTNLASIILPEDLKKLGDSAFEGCTALTTIDIPDGAVSLGKNCFYNDIKLDDIYLPLSLTEIGGSAFSCNNNALETMRLMDVYYGGTDDDWDALLASGKVGPSNELLTTPAGPEGKNFRYKANKYFDSRIELPVPQIKKVEYIKGGVSISWDKVSVTVGDQVISPEYYHIYQNHDTSKTVNQQWEQQTPLWTEVGYVSGSEDKYVYSITETMKPGDVYNFRIVAEFDLDEDGNYGTPEEGENSKLGTYFEYEVPVSEDDFVATTDLDFEKPSYTLILNAEDEKAGQVTVPVQITPDNASKQNYAWESKDPSVAVATVSDDKKSVLVTAKGVGNTTVSVTTADGKITASFKVFVVDADTILPTKISFDTQKVEVAENGTAKVSINIEPSDAKASYIWESDNTKYATVKVAEDEKSAVVTGVLAGETKIIVTSSNGITAEIPVVVGKGTVTPEKVNNTFSKEDAVIGAKIDANHNVKLDVDADGNFTGATITNAKGEVDKDADSNLVNIVTEYNTDGTPKTFYTLVFTDGKWDTSYDSATKGAYTYNGVDYFVAGGVVNQNANGLIFTGSDGWKFLAAGHVVTGNKGLVMYNGEWFWIDDKGSCDDTYAAIVKWNGSDFLVHGGRLRTDYTGFTYDPQKKSDWYHITNGQVWGDGTITDISIEGGTITRNVVGGKVQ